MSGYEHFGAMMFARDRVGQLYERRTYMCSDDESARKLAEDCVIQGRAIGAVAFLRKGAGEFDEGEMITLIVFGDVPENAILQLPF